MKYKYLIWIALGTALVLMIPLIAMQFTNEVMWTLSDFIFAGLLIFGTGAAYACIAAQKGAAYKGGIALALLGAFLLIWINGAVGIIGDEDTVANALYLGVIMIGIVGAVASGLNARRMSYAMFVTACAQALVPVIAFLVWSPENTSWGEPGVVGIVMLNTFFVMLFSISALLFRQSAQSISAS